MPQDVISFDGRHVKFYNKGELLDFVTGPSPFAYREYDCSDVEFAKKIFATEAAGYNTIYDVRARQLYSIWQQPKVTISGFRAKVP